MKTNSIEQMERVRYNLLLMQIISFGIWFAGMIILQFPLSRIAMTICTLLTVVFALLFIYTSFKNFFTYRKIKRNPELANALGNEMYLSFDYKATLIGLYSTIACALLIYIFEGYFNLSVKLFCMIIIYVSVISTGVSRLILYR